MRHYKIYVLKCPYSKKVKYVGQTHLELSKRYRAHFQWYGDNPKWKWIDGLSKNNRKPILELIEILYSQEKAHEREAYWINHFMTLKHPILNVVVLSRYKHMIDNPKLLEANRKDWRTGNPVFEKRLAIPTL